VTSTENLGNPSNKGSSDPVDLGQELDAVRRHICHILGFDFGIIDVLRPDGLVKLLTFSIEEENENEYSMDSLVDSNGEALNEPNSQIARDIVQSQVPYVGKCSIKGGNNSEQFAYLAVPIAEGYENRWVVKGVLRLVSFDETREIDENDMQTLRIVGQHLASRLPSLALQVLKNQNQNATLSDFDLKNVVLVHPNRVVRRRFSRTLSSVYRISETDNAAKCAEILSTTPADLIVIDSQITGPNGEAIYKSLKQKNETKYTPLIVVTTESGPESRLDCLGAGADDCVDENCLDAELLARARSLLRVKKTERELAMQLKLMEDYTKRLEQVGEKEREANARISKTYAELEIKSKELREKQREAEIRRNQDTLLHRISNTLRRSFNIEENIAQMLEELAGWVHLDCCFVVLPSEEEPYDALRQEYCTDPSYSLMDKDKDLQLLELFKVHFNPQDDVFVSDVLREKKCDPFRKEVLANYHIYSLFYLPITYEGKVHGVLGGHKCESEQIWSTDNQNFLRQVADQLSTSVTTARLYRRVERQATTDGLTSLFNHRTGQEKLAEQLRLAERYGRNLCTIMLDVDHFKSINDTYGHPVGDTVLKSVAHIIKRDCRDVDIPVRYGGEEFLIVLPEVNIEGARVVAERLRKTLNREVITHEDIQLNVSASLGVACYPDDGDNQHQLLELADKALYMSKRMGRNQVHIASELKFKDLREAKPAPPVEAAANPEDQAATAAPENAQSSQLPVPPGPKAAAKPASQPGEHESVLVPEVVETVKKMAGALYSKSEYNKVHHLETARFAEMVAKVLGLSAKQVEQIRVASLLHDVGLLRVPEDIINKKGQVTADELKMLMQHPTLGADMLRSVPALKEICDILEHHHECWDGTGYPRGLKGDEIPLAARIVSIVEAYHAMISDRPYRPAMSPEKAKRVLKSAAHTQFDPFLVDIFLAVLAELETAKA
jgi:diguanylate cyclase (GGDEF)-like protein/putative nucleotidyltransferase with HDIG domain